MFKTRLGIFADSSVFFIMIVNLFKWGCGVFVFCEASKMGADVDGSVND